MSNSPALKRLLPPALLLAVAWILVPGAAQAQPFGTWITFVGNPTHGYVRVPHSPALNPTGAFTVEAWVSISNNPAGEDCRSIIGKNWQQAWWLGLCTVGGQPTLRSYLKGAASLRQGGVIPPNVWTHVAVVFTGTRRLHYVNGVLTGDFPETAPLTTSGSELRIGSDVAWQFTPSGAIDEVRLWNVARTQAQLRANINVPITAPQAGLVALWNFQAGGADAVGPHDGNLQGAGVGFLVFPVGGACNNTATTLCLDGRFVVSVTWSTGPGSSGAGMRVPCATTDSGLFWFFSADNWELMVKAVNGCGLNNRHWIFSAATTNVFYRLQVTDVVGRAQKIYFNYTGPPAPAVTDTSAFATCP
jgi:hypothetical protein